MASENLYWIWLAERLGAGSRHLLPLIEKFSSPFEVYNLPEDELVMSGCIPEDVAHRLASKDLDKACEIMDSCVLHNIGILSYSDKFYPSSLRSLQDPPAVLYYRGSLIELDKKLCIAVVGTRKMSEYGKRAAYKISYELGGAEVVVVSGMALGIDSVAACGAITGGGKTIAVLGCGIDIAYPRQHAKLQRIIENHGVVMSEFAPGTPPAGVNFPIRNRIISGLCSLTVVIEGSEKSGAVITARHALKQERTVYALPGNVGMKGSEATSMLLKNGARVCTCADDIIRDFADKSGTSLNPFNLKSGVRLDVLGYLREYGVAATCPSDDVFYHGKSRSSVSLSDREDVKPVADKADTMKAPTSPPDGFDKKALMLYKRIPGTGDCSLDSLVGEDFPIKDVMKYLLKLEMNGFVTMLPGERVARKFK